MWVRRNRRRFAAHTRLYACEQLERRVLLSVSAPGIPAWVSQGPTPVLGSYRGLPREHPDPAPGQPTPPGNPSAGAVQAVAIYPGRDPADPRRNTMFVASVNGGIWKTTNGNRRSDGLDNDSDGQIDEFDEQPLWSPLTDRLGQLSFGDLTYDRSDPTHSTLWAAIGRFSNFGADTAPALGLLKTTDDGANWSYRGGDGLTGQNLLRVLPTGETVGGGQVVFAASTNASGGGLFRSVDGGNHFDRLSGLPGAQQLPDLPVTDIVADPTQHNPFYAAVPGAGVYVSNDSGAHWNTLKGEPDELLGKKSPRIALAVYQNAASGVSALYVAFIDTSNLLSATYRYDPSTNIWVSLGQPPTTGLAQGFTNTSLVADPTNPFLFYVGQSSQHIYRGNGDPSLPAGANRWVQMSYNTEGGYPEDNKPHPDSRDMAFDANGALIEVDDGGIYRLTDPGTGSDPMPGDARPYHRWWTSMNGNLTSTEMTGVAYDRLNDIFLGGAWDNGSLEQLSPNSRIFDASGAGGGDGGLVAVDNGFDKTYRYFSEGNNNLASLRRRDADAGNVITQSTPGAVVMPTGPGKVDTADAADTAFEIVVNAVAPAIGPSRLTIGTTRSIYESSNAGGSVSKILDLADGNYGQPMGRGIAAGGRRGGIDQPGVTYLCLGPVGSRPMANTGLFLRDDVSPIFRRLTTYPGTSPAEVTLDPEDWKTAFVLDQGAGNSRIYMTLDPDGPWTTITRNLNSLLMQFEQFTSIKAVRAGKTLVLLAGGAGGVYRLIDPADPNSRWSEYGTGLPNVRVNDIDYYVGAATANGTREDLLVVSTIGRGIFSISSASGSLALPGDVVVNGTNGDDLFHVYRDQSLLRIDQTTAGVTTTTAIEYNAIDQLQINGLAGADELQLDQSMGTIAPVLGVYWDGGANAAGAGDRLTLIGINGNDHVVIYDPRVEIDDTTVVYSNTETMTIDTALGNDTVAVDAAGVPDVRIGMGGGFDSVNLGPGSHDVSALNTHFDIDLGGDDLADAVVVSNEHAGAAQPWALTNSQLTRGAFSLIHFTHVSHLTLSLDANNNFVQISGGAPLTTINGGAGDDIFELGASSFASVTINGSDPLQPASPGDTLRVVGFVIDAIVSVTHEGIGSGTVHFTSPLVSTHHYTGIESIEFVDLLNVSMLFQGIAQANLLATLSSLNAEVNSIVAFLGNDPIPPITFSKVGRFTLDTTALGGDDTLTVDKTFTAPDTLNEFVLASGAGNDVLNLNESSMTLASDAGLASKNLTVNLLGSAVLTLDASQHLAGLNIMDGGTVQMTPGGNKVLVTPALFVREAAARLDLADNALIVNYDNPLKSPLLMLRDQVMSGFGGGNKPWTGPGINSSKAAGNSSSSALGYAEAADVLNFDKNGLANFAGETVDTTAVLVRYTLSGDADLDQSVGFGDLVRVAQNYGQSNGDSLWSRGDFTFDGKVGFADLVKVAQNYGAGASAPSAAAAPIPSVPPIAGKSGNTKRPKAGLFNVNSPIRHPSPPARKTIARGRK